MEATQLLKELERKIESGEIRIQTSPGAVIYGLTTTPPKVVSVNLTSLRKSLLGKYGYNS